MLDAKSAREKSMDADRGRSDMELEVVEREIINACNNGRMSVDIKVKLLSSTIKRLEDMGYIITFIDDQREMTAWTTISWKE